MLDIKLNIMHSDSQETKSELYDKRMCLTVSNLH